MTQKSEVDLTIKTNRRQSKLNELFGKFTFNTFMTVQTSHVNGHGPLVSSVEHNFLVKIQMIT